IAALRRNPYQTQCVGLSEIWFRPVPHLATPRWKHDVVFALYAEEKIGFLSVYKFITQTFKVFSRRPRGRVAEAQRQKTLLLPLFFKSSGCCTTNRRQRYRN